MKRLLVAAAILLPLCAAHAEISQMDAVEAPISGVGNVFRYEVFRGTLNGPLAKHPGDVILNADGTWNVSSWQTVKEMAEVGGAYGLGCVARKLLAMRRKLRFVSYITKSNSPVITHDPVMDACGIKLQAD